MCVEGPGRIGGNSPGESEPCRSAPLPIPVPTFKEQSTNYDKAEAARSTSPCSPYIGGWPPHPSRVSRCLTGQGTVLVFWDQALCLFVLFFKVIFVYLCVFLKVCGACGTRG